MLNCTRSLSAILDAIASFWKLHGSIESSDELAGIMRTLRATLDDCRVTLERLEAKLSKTGRSKVENQFRLSLRMPDIQLLRQRVQSHTGAATLAMHAVNM
jgi:hypothetical protein